MIYIDLSKFKPSDEWLEKSQNLLAQLYAVRDDKVERDLIIRRNKKVWKELKEDLKKLSFGKCWYSEAREIFSHYHIDHFRPKLEVIDAFNDDNPNKDGYWWLAFEYTNYRLAGSVGNVKKSNHFAVKSNYAKCPENDISDEVIYFLDPTKPNDYKKLTVDEFGVIKPSNPNKSSWDNIKAAYTIDYLHLYYPDLQEERRSKWKKAKILMDNIDIADEEFNLNPSASREHKYNTLIEEMRKMIAPCEELSATVRACMKASRKDWALDLLAENISLEKYCEEYKS